MLYTGSQANASFLEAMKEDLGPDTLFDLIIDDGRALHRTHFSARLQPSCAPETTLRYPPSKVLSKVLKLSRASHHSHFSALDFSLCV